MAAKALRHLPLERPHWVLGSRASAHQDRALAGTPHLELIRVLEVRERRTKGAGGDREEGGGAVLGVCANSTAAKTASQLPRLSVYCAPPESRLNMRTP